MPKGSTPKPICPHPSPRLKGHNCPFNFAQNPSLRSRDSMQKYYSGQTLSFQSAGIPFKIRSWSPKSNLLFLLSKHCIYTSLVKIHPLFQKIECGILHRHQQDLHQNQYVPHKCNTIAAQFTHKMVHSYGPKHSVIKGVHCMLQKNLFT